MWMCSVRLADQQSSVKSLSLSRTSLARSRLCLCAVVARSPGELAGHVSDPHCPSNCDIEVGGVLVYLDSS